MLFYFCLFSSLFYYDIDVISALLTRHFSDYKSVTRGHDGRCERTRRSVPFGGCQSLQKPLSGFIRRMSTRPLVRLRGDRYLLGHGPRCHQSGLGYLLLFHYVSFSFAFFPLSLPPSLLLDLFSVSPLPSRLSFASLLSPFTSPSRLERYCRGRSDGETDR